MEEVVDGTRRAIIVECKHTETVGRPVVQKLHSAIATFDFDGPKRGMVVTTGRFTNPSPGSTPSVSSRTMIPIPSSCSTARTSGRSPTRSASTSTTVGSRFSATKRSAPTTSGRCRHAGRRVPRHRNIEAGDLPEPHSAVTFRPVVAVTADTNAVFETSVGVIHRINDRTRFVVHAERGQPQVVDEDVGTLVTENLHATVDLDSKQFAEVFDDVEERRFGQTQTEYKGMGRRAAPAAPHDNGDLHRRQQRHVQQDLRAEPLGRLRPVDRAGVPSEVRHITDIQGIPILTSTTQRARPE